MKRSMIAVVSVMAVVAVMLAAGAAQAAPTWYTITFTGTEMFNYTTTVAPRADQDAPRRLRDYAGNTIVRSDGDADSDGINDFAEWAQGTPGLAGFGFSYFNLWGATIGADSWDQPYHAVPDQGDGEYGAESWRNQMVNGVPVDPGMGSVGHWDGGIVLANQSYNPTNYAWPVWRAPTGTQVTMANAASLEFSVDVLMENYDTAFEPDGKLRVFFGGFNAPQGVEGHDVSGIILTPEPATMALLALGGIGMLLRRRRRK